MSFSENLKSELLSGQRKLTCCKKAFIYGALINSFPTEDGKISFETEQKEVSDEFFSAIKEQFGKEPELTARNRIGHERHVITFDSRSARETLSRFDAEENETFEHLVGFRCEACRMNFLKGAFLACASASDPLKSYHLEFLVKTASRAKQLYIELREAGFEPKIANRRSGVGLYFKDSESIEDILTYLGASRMLFECMNDKIVRDIRNSTNRRANCETGNIAKSVKASQETIAAIKELRDRGLLEALPDDLRETAEIRLENPEAPLSEMCLMFSPPLSKSGLSHRFAKIKEFAEEKCK